MSSSLMRWAIGAMCIAGMFASGCQDPNKPVYVYGGPVRPGAQVAELKCDYDTFMSGILGPVVHSISDANGTPIWKGYARVFYLEPGMSTLQISYGSDDRMAPCFASSSGPYPPSSNIATGAATGAASGAATGFAAAYSRQVIQERTAATIKVNFDAGGQYILKAKKNGLFVWQYEATYWIEQMPDGRVVYGVKPEEVKNEK